MGFWRGRLRSQPRRTWSQRYGPAMSGQIWPGGTYGDLEIDHLLGECAHLIVKAEAVFAHVKRREDKIALPLLGAVENDFVGGADNRVVDIEGASGLHLFTCPSARLSLDPATTVSQCGSGQPKSNCALVFWVEHILQSKRPAWSPCSQRSRRSMLSRVLLIGR